MDLLKDVEGNICVGNRPSEYCLYQYQSTSAQFLHGFRATQGAWFTTSRDLGDVDNDDPREHQYFLWSFTAQRV